MHFVSLSNYVLEYDIWISGFQTSIVFYREL